MRIGLEMKKGFFTLQFNLNDYLTTANNFMKIKNTLFLLLLSSFFLNSKCKTENIEPQLPPETTIGAMTFGCKIDGKVFVPKDGGGLSGLKTEYLFLGNGQGGGWFLNIGAANRVDNPRKNVAIETDSLLLIEGNSYVLKKMKGFAYCHHLSDIISYQMGPDDIGELIITKHSQTQRILSGRFSFTATNVNDQTKKVNITEGRFDIRY